VRLEELFGKTRTHWVKYSAYEYREDENGTLFITPAGDAKVSNIYNPLKDSDALVVDALNVGLLGMRRAGEDEQKKAVLDFVTSYGLLGFMTALPTAPDFMDFDTVFLPKNQYIEAETMPRMEYLDLFYPFEKLDVVENDRGDVKWDIEDREMVALNLTMNGLPMAANMTYHWAYSEPYEWVRTELKDWAFTLLTPIYYAEEKDETIKDLYQRGLYAFGGIAPTYHILIDEGKPVIVWDFQSLMRVIKMAFSYALTDEKRPLRICKNCTKAFIASRPQREYCSPECREQHREKKKGK
jgi:hypothetical protein